jgi:hypothetical protein
MIISVDKFYSEQIRLGQRIAGEVVYPDLQAAVQMADLVERIVVTAGEDPTSPTWNATIGALNAALATLEPQPQAVTHG